MSFYIHGAAIWRSHLVCPKNFSASEVFLSYSVMPFLSFQALELNNAGTDMSCAQTASDNNGEGSDGSQHEHAPAHVQSINETLKVTDKAFTPRKNRCGILVKDVHQNGNMSKEANGSTIPESQREHLLFSSQKNDSALSGKVVWSCLLNLFLLACK